MKFFLLTFLFYAPIKYVFSSEFEYVSPPLNKTQLDEYCANFPDIRNATIRLLPTVLVSAHIVCDPGFKLEGPPKLLCRNKSWVNDIAIRCAPKCYRPVFITNGGFEFEDKDEDGMYGEGTLATYSCNDGYSLSPAESIFRVCENGSWTGITPTCVPNMKYVECPPPRNISNGYYVPEDYNELGQGYTMGQRIHYGCNTGYILQGDRFQQCLGDGSWLPKILPVCTLMLPLENTRMCQQFPAPPQSIVTTVISGAQFIGAADTGTEIEIRCISKYHNSRSPCEQYSRLRCISGRWVGVIPKCVPVKECPPPPSIMYGQAMELALPFEDSKPYKYPIDVKVTYQCLPGYELQGNTVLTCTPGGCWTPQQIPICKSTDRFFDLKASAPLTVSLATGVGVLTLLAIICAVVICRKRKPMARARAVPLPPPVQRPGLADHATLLNHPDRLALIAFADGIQGGQPVLPTYEEATRDRGPSFGRLQRPQWPSLVARRTRGSPNPDMVHITRQGSFASHTASSRSGGDPMGSTDTMAVSENSTTVTLDTASSHSQPASCRAHCGSLASFDTNSVLNTEGVPLLEESELEEIQGGDSVSLAMENRSMADNNSFKFSTSTDVA